MYANAQKHFEKELQEIRDAGLWKEERVILSPQAAKIRVQQGEVLNFCANNYLGLSSHPGLVKAAQDALGRYGLGMSSVRFICGTQDIHKELEKKIAHFLGFDDAILYSSCFDANGGVFETLLKEDSAVISDELNHASIIDGIRLCKAERLRYKHLDLADLEAKLVAAKGAKIRLVVTDGVFSMDGDIAPLAEIANLCEKHDALLMVDDSHATGFIGKTGRGTPEHCGVQGRVDLLSSTLGKALGGSAGGFVAAKAGIVALLRQRSRPYLFSNTVAPPIVAATIAVFDLIAGSTALRDKLEANTKWFREQMTKAGFQIRPGVHPICPLMLGDAKLAQTFAKELLPEGIYVIGFSFPVVPMGQARIRVQISAGHERDHLEKAVAAFTKVGKRLGVVK
ncbi:MAG TPA: glycine C-acetyltransferase [Planctomycetota bacterium]|jgi:glycine C-acetyltransferase|nr:glycine C-acetyltransferase [Planctomycetota bacterium]